MTAPDDPAGSNPYDPPSPGATPPPPPPPGQPPQYGQPQYGQPQYGQPQYGQPPYGQPPQWGGQRAPGTNGFAIASIVCAFLCSPLGIVFGIVARNQIRRTGQGGDGLALAGIIISVVSIALGIILLAVNPGSTSGT